MTRAAALATVSAFALATALLPGSAVAGSSSSATIELNQGAADLAARLGLDMEGFEAEVREGITDALGIEEVGAFLRSFSNATSFSNRGLGVDYASNSERAIIGIGANLAVAADLSGELPAVGAAANATLMAGMNLRRWGHPELTVFANGFSRSASTEHLHGRIASVGGHVQYKLFTPTRGLKRLLAQWGGVDITTGIEVAHWSYGLRGDLSTSFDLQGANGAATTIEAAAAGSIDLSATTVTVPLEVTSNLRIFYVASLYLGFGLDAQLGSSRLDLGLSGSLTGTRPDTGEAETIGALTMTGTGSKGPAIVGYHALVGVQANLWRLKIFAQATLQPVETASVALGVRAVL
jgi:hypothetical protein